MKRVFFLFCFMCFISPLYPQIGGSNTFEFINLNTSPRIIALGGYLTSVIDSDLNNGIYNPALINSLMCDNMVFNYTNYYAGISYGDVGYAFNIGNRNLITSMKFINYGEFIETNEFGYEIGTFRSSEYLFSTGSNHFFSDSLLSVGINTKLAYSSLYELNSFGFLFDFGVLYNFPRKNISGSVLIKNLGYQIIPYYEDQREPLPFEILVGFSNKLAHVPLRWHLTFQHIETPDLGFENSNLTLQMSDDNFGYDILKHVVFGAEFLIHENISVLLGYNNRRRFEMIIEDRRGLVGFSYGLSFRIKRFQFNYSRALNHLSGPVSSFGITTNLKKID